MTSKKFLKIIITAGPTREPIDKIRFISNHSTGTLGFELAKEARKRNHSVILISGPVNLKTPKKVKRFDIITAIDMQKEINKRFAWCDCLIMSAAISDYRPKRYISGKLKKKKSQISLKLVRNPDILETLGRTKKDKVLVGFALETDKLIQNAKSKLKKKSLDLIIANRKSSNMNPFGKNKIAGYIIDKQLKVKKFSNISKSQLSKRLLDSIEELCYT